jgi:hypothetical protein
LVNQFPSSVVFPGGVEELAASIRPGAGAPSATFSEPWWFDAIWSPRFVDMVDPAVPSLYDTSCACVATDDGLRIGFRVEEPFPTALLTDRDSLVFQENDVEFFLDFGTGYYEFEINAAGTIYEVLHVWRDTFAATSFANDPTFALDSPHCYTFGGDHDRRPATFWDGLHPRGARYAFRDFDLSGLQSTVIVDGALNDPTRTSAGWTAEVLLPWDGLGSLGISPVAPGDELRIGFMRFQQIALSGQRNTGAWSLTPHLVLESHLPNRFTTVAFRY